MPFGLCTRSRRKVWLREVDFGLCLTGWRSLLGMTGALAATGLACDTGTVLACSTGKPERASYWRPLMVMMFFLVTSQVLFLSLPTFLCFYNYRKRFAGFVQVVLVRK